MCYEQVQLPKSRKNNKLTGSQNLWQMTPVVSGETTPCSVLIICFSPLIDAAMVNRVPFHLKKSNVNFYEIFERAAARNKSQEGQWLLFFCDGRYFPFFMTLHSNEMNVSATVVFSSDSIFLLITL